MVVGPGQGRLIRIEQGQVQKDRCGPRQIGPENGHVDRHTCDETGTGPASPFNGSGAFHLAVGQEVEDIAAEQISFQTQLFGPFNQCGGNVLFGT